MAAFGEAQYFMMPRYGMDVPCGGNAMVMDMAGTWILYIKNEVLDTIQHDMLCCPF